MHVTVLCSIRVYMHPSTCYRTLPFIARTCVYVHTYIHIYAETAVSWRHDEFYVCMYFERITRRGRRNMYWKERVKMKGCIYVKGKELGEKKETEIKLRKIKLRNRRTETRKEGKEKKKKASSEPPPAENVASVVRSVPHQDRVCSVKVPGVPKIRLLYI